MPKAFSKFYNWRTRLWHHFLRRPAHLRAVFERKVKDPELTVIFLHGISATSDTWKTTLRQFAQAPELKHVRLLAFDLLGFGKSLQADWLDYRGVGPVGPFLQLPEARRHQYRRRQIGRASGRERI